MVSTNVYLSQGSTGEDVKELQLMLKAQGYDVGPVDGIFGNQTEAAVRNYQREHKLEVDGIAGPQTLGKLTQKTTIEDSYDKIEAQRLRIWEDYYKSTETAESTLKSINSQSEERLNTAETVLEGLPGHVTNYINIPGVQLEEAADKLTTDINDVLRQTSQTYNTTASEILVDINDIDTTANNILKNVGIGVGATATNSVDLTRQLVINVTNTAQNESQGLLTNIKEFFKDIYEWGLQQIDRIIDSIKFIIDSIGDVFDYLFDELVKVLKGALEWTEEGLAESVIQIFKIFQDVSRKIALKSMESEK